MARVLPRRLAPVLPTTYSWSGLDSTKVSSKKRRHSESLHHACAHCESFATAASRRTWILVSESISGLPLSRPVPIIALPGFYPSNKLIGRSPILSSIRAHSVPFSVNAFYMFGIEKGFPASLTYPPLAPVSRDYGGPKGRLTACFQQKDVPPERQSDTELCALVLPSTSMS